MEPTCEKCGSTENVGGLLKDLKNIQAGFKAFYCKGCIPDLRADTNEHGTVWYPTREIAVEDLPRIMEMENPDISCDFCDTPDPKWVYDLAKGDAMIPDMDFGTRWAACQECVERIESGKEPKRGDLPSHVPFTARVFHHMMVSSLHQQVMVNISNKRAYVRDSRDGRVKYK